MTRPAEETGLRKAESLFYTLAGSKLGKLMCRQVMENLKRLLRRIDSIQSLSSHVRRLLVLGFLSSNNSEQEEAWRCLPLHPWD